MKTILRVENLEKYYGLRDNVTKSVFRNSDEKI